jgi:ferrous iron transport protein A
MELLSAIKPGEIVVIENLIDSSLKSKILELGLIIGKEVRVLFKAPLGDPIAIDLGDSVLSLRLDEAKLIQVKNIE